jgi:anti-anti-sigma factor
MSLAITYEQKAPGVFTVHLAGSLDTDTYQSYETEINKLYAEFPAVKVIVLDMEGVSYISSAGVRVVLATKKKLKSMNGELGILKMQPQIEKVFAIIKALPSLQVYSSVEELDAYLKVIQKKVVEGDL